MIDPSIGLAGHLAGYLEAQGTAVACGPAVYRGGWRGTAVFAPPAVELEELGGYLAIVEELALHRLIAIPGMRYLAFVPGLARGNLGEIFEPHWGLCSRQDFRILINLEPDPTRWAQRLDDAEQIAYAAPTREAFIRRILVHEAGHCFHNQNVERVDAALAALERHSDGEPCLPFVTARAAMNRREYFAECFAAYYLEAAWLRKVAPQACAMVESAIAQPRP